MNSMMGANSGSMKEKIPKGYKKGSINNFDEKQNNLYQGMFDHLGPDSFLYKLSQGDDSFWDEIEEPAMRQFAGLQGNIASKFSGMGMGGRRSSGFKNTLNQAGSDFASDLQSKRLGLQQQALKDLMGMSGDLLNQRPQENFLVKKQPSFWESLAGSLGENAGALPAAYAKSQWGV